MSEKLIVTSSPHIRHEDTTRSIMCDVLIALAPAAVYGCILFGWQAALVLLTTVLSAVLAEFVWCWLLHKPVTVGDCSAAVTGLLLGMNLSPSLPLWMAAIGSIVAVIIVKQMFGGLGQNFANPAIAARIVLLVSFPKAMTTFVEPLSKKLDVVAGPTPLAADKVPSLKELFLGWHSGCIGETTAMLLLIGGIYLLLRRVINPVIPLSFIGTVFGLYLIGGAGFDGALVGILSGGLMLGAIFMATNYTTSPTTNWGKLIFGIGCGILTFVIRRFANLPEGVSYSILLMNILTPHINSLTLSKPFGAKEAAKNG